MMIDPQLQASRWIKNILKQENIRYLKVGSDSFLKQIESALRMKIPVIIETSENGIDPTIDSLVSKEYEHNNNRYFVKLGENKIEVDLNYKVYVFTKIANPYF